MKTKYDVSMSTYVRDHVCMHNVVISQNGRVCLCPGKKKMSNMLPTYCTLHYVINYAIKRIQTLQLQPQYLK